MKPYLEKIQTVLSEVGSSKTGLTTDEAIRRLEKDGPNKLEEGQKVSLLQRFLKELADPMIIILIAAAIVSGITAAFAHESYADVIIIMVVVILNSVLGVLQESKAEKAIAALQEIAAATSKVLRDGHQVTVRSEALAVGDVIILEAGDSIPADARIIECASMKIEESALTGESVPVEKTSKTLKSEDGRDIPLGDRKNMCYMGSTLVYGRGVAVITATGMATEMGKIASALTQAKEEQTPLQRKLSELSRILTFVVLGICAVVFVVSLIRAGQLKGDVILSTFMVSVSLAVAAIPEGLAAVVTIVLSIGVTNMSKRNAVIRKLTAVETLGCTQIICSDKTGTLTQNKMTVVEHSTENLGLLCMGMALCSDAVMGQEKEAIGEPTECALVNDAAKNGFLKECERYKRVGEAPFDSMRKMMTVVLSDDSPVFLQFTKGAPDEVLKQCRFLIRNGEVSPMTEADKKAILEINKGYADQALRVLCLAFRQWNSKPADNTPEFLEKDLCYVGLSCMIDPVRPEVVPAIAECRRAGIRPIMITGDHKDTAVAIAKSLGMIKSADEAITGADLNEIPDEQFATDVRKYRVYARVQPEHKVRIVKAWQALGKVTAMTGDGVNDAPAIKSADIGVGMGITGTDVTKNVADMVLADDNFATIVSAVEEGRRIYDNICKAIQFLLASNLAEVLAVFIASLCGFTILEPVQLLWINLITDSLPALALGMEIAEADIMQRKPRSAREGIFGNGLGLDVLIQGAITTALVLIAYFIGVGHQKAMGLPVDEINQGMTMGFITLAMTEIFHSFNMRSRRKSLFSIKHQNIWLWGAMVASFFCTTLVVELPALAKAFKFAEISIGEYIISMLLAVSIIPIMELVKMLQRKAGK